MVLLSGLALGGSLLGAGLQLYGQDQRESAVEGNLADTRARQQAFNDQRQQVAQNTIGQFQPLFQQAGRSNVDYANQFGNLAAALAAQQQAGQALPYGQQFATQNPAAAVPQGGPLGGFTQQARAIQGGLANAAFNTQGQQAGLQAMGAQDALSRQQFTNDLLGLANQGSFIDQLGQLQNAQNQLTYQQDMGQLAQAMQGAQREGAGLQMLGGLVQQGSQIPLALGGG